MLSIVRFYFNGELVELTLELPDAPRGIFFNYYGEPTISWAPDELAKDMFNKNGYGAHPFLTNGVVSNNPAAGQVVLFRIMGKSVKIKTSRRPDLKLLADYAGMAGEITSEHQRRYREQKQAEIDAPALAEMEAQLVEHRRSIPKGMVAVEAKQTGTLDGAPIMEYRAAGVEVSWRDIVIVGRACAIRPGALSAFKSELVAYIVPDKLKMVVEAIADRQRELAANRIAEQDRVAGIFAEARSMEVPQVLSTWLSYRCMNGNPDCSFDVAKEMAQPDGSKETVYFCCY